VFEQRKKGRPAVGTLKKGKRKDRKRSIRKRPCVKRGWSWRRGEKVKHAPGGKKERGLEGNNF